MRWSIERLDEAKFGYLLLTPMFLVILTFAIYPLVRTFLISLQADDPIGAHPVGDFVGLRNYIRILTGEAGLVLNYPFFNLEAPFSSALPVTVIITLVSVTVGTLLGLVMALILNREFRGRAYARTLVILPWTIPIVIQGMMFYLLFQPSISFIVEPLHDLGLFSANPLISSRDSTIIVILVDIWRQIPFVALVVLAGLASIDQSLYKVAEVAGATPWQQFRYITFPLIKPVLLIAMIFYTIGSMKVYGIVEASAGCSTVPTLSCIVVDTFRQLRWATASALSFITAIIIGIIVMIYVIQFRGSVDNA